MKNLLMFVFAFTFAIGIGQDAFAYIGPGAGLSMLGAFWGLVVAVLAALSFLILWPLRRMFKKSSATAEVDSQDKPAR
jgi:membrane protein implicated in regulation of membrane protease activity